jgi:hypothetical protein
LKKDIVEAGNPAQQAAIAVAMKKAGKKPKQMDEDIGSWIVYDPETRQIKKRFKTHTAGKSYAQTHKLGFASSEYYFDRVKDNKEVAETALNPRDPHGDYSAKRKALQDLGMNKAVDQQAVLQRRLDLDREAKAKGVTEVAPPGAKAERMVKHIKQGYAKDGKLTPKEKGIAFATAWKAHNAGRVEEQDMAEAAQGHTIEAHGVRGMDRRTWHKTFRNTDQMIAWAEKHDAEIIGTRDLEQSRHGNLSPARQDMAEDTTDDLLNMRRDDPRIKRNQDITALAKEIYAQMVAERGQPMDRRQQQTWMAIAQTKAAAQLSNTSAQNESQGVAEAEKNPHTSALGRALYRDLSKEKKASPQQVQRNKERWAQRQAEREQGVADGEIERQHGDIKPWAYWSFPERVAKKLYQIHKGQPIGKTAIVQLWKTDGPDRMTKFMFKPDVSAILSAYQQMSEQDPLFKPGVAEGLTEMDKSEPSAGRDTGPRSGPDKEAKPITAKKATKDAADMLTRAVKDSHKKKDVKESDTLMNKLRRAMVREGRVKELADDLKTLNDAEFMKKYGKAKAAIRKDMKRVDEAAPTNYTPQEMSDILSGKKTQQQVDAERAQKPLKEVDAPAMPADHPGEVVERLLGTCTSVHVSLRRCDLLHPE